MLKLPLLLLVMVCFSCAQQSGSVRKSTSANIPESSITDRNQDSGQNTIDPFDESSDTSLGTEENSGDADEEDLTEDDYSDTSVSDASSGVNAALENLLKSAGADTSVGSGLTASNPGAGAAAQGEESGLVDIHHFYHDAQMDHYYTTDKEDEIDAGYSFNQTVFTAYQNEVPGKTRPIYRCKATETQHSIAMTENCNNQAPDGILAHVYVEQDPVKAPVQIQMCIKAKGEATAGERGVYRYIVVTDIAVCDRFAFAPGPILGWGLDPQPAD